MPKQKEQECPKGAPLWMTTYGDMVTLILTFFVLLLSFSSMREAKFRRAMGALQGALGVLPFEQSVVRPEHVPIPQLSNLQESEVQESLVKMEDIMSQEQLDEVVKLQMSDRGLKVTIDNPVLFETGRADMKPSVYPILGAVAALADGWPNIIRVEGHTDDQAIHTDEFPSNWELSAQRAINVARYFVEDQAFEGDRVQAIARAQYAPLVPNTSDANRATNRRIEIFIEYKADVIPPAKIQMEE